LNSANRIDFNLELLDAEWVDLILNARKIGLSISEIRSFLANPGRPNLNVYLNTENAQYASN
jgi:DNA-binding transcriptional MerR regulator